MENLLLPNIKTNPYNRSKLGIFGNLGKGANADILFLETVISIDELDSITLISNIPGSESWDVRDLFQRDVDDDRVKEDIIPYFKDNTKIKYFSPITLILLPTENEKRDIIKKIDYIDPSNSEEEGVEIFYEKSGFYKLNIYKHEDPIAKLEWSDRNCFLVAIDGQHRLSGLKRWKSEPNSNFKDWKIPVVILNIFKVDKDKSTASLLEIVRKTFVYINTKAERINKAREILLNDESVNAICTQEIVQFSHKNDVKSIEKRDKTIIPLIFFDWQGRVVNKKQYPGPASIKSIEEIYNWFNEYLLREDGDDFQKSELFLGDLVPPLEGYGPKLALSHNDANRIRTKFNEIVLPGLLFLLQNFIPYKIYIQACLEKEKKAISRSDTANHAFMKLRFGTHNAPDDQREAVQKEYDTLKNEFEELQKKIDFTIRQDIGMRGIIYAFAECKELVIDFGAQNIDWLTFSKKYTEAINELYEQKWFESFDNLKSKHKDFLTFLIYDEAGSVINYKFSHAKDALGSLIVILVFEIFMRKKIFNIDKEDRFEEIWGEYSNNLRKTYEKGLRRKFKAQLTAEDWKGTMTEFNEKVKTLAEKESTRKINLLYKFICKKK